MKRRLLSLLLTLAMLFTMVPMMGIGVGAVRYTHYCDVIDSTLCNELPYAYRAMRVKNSEDFFSTWINLYDVRDDTGAIQYGYDYDSDKFQSMVENSLSTTLIENTSPLENVLVDFNLLRSALTDGSVTDLLFTESDLYDALFLNMLLESAKSNDVAYDIIEESQNIVDMLGSAVKVGDPGDTATYTVYTVEELLKSTEYDPDDVANLLRGGMIGGMTIIAFDDCFPETRVKEVINFIDEKFTIDLSDSNFPIYKGDPNNPKPSDGKIDGLTVVTTLLGIVLDGINTTMELIDAIENILTVCMNVGPRYAEILHKIYYNTDNSYIKSSAVKYYGLIASDNWFEYIGAICLEVINSGVKFTIGFADTIVKTFAETYWAYATISQVSKIIDKILGADAIAEAAFVLRCLNDLDNALVKTLVAIDSSFKT